MFWRTIRGSREEWVLLFMEGDARAHWSPAVKDRCHKHYILAWYSEPHTPHKSNVITRSIGKTFKRLAIIDLDDWLGAKANRGH